jgi:hypothetical protein
MKKNIFTIAILSLALLSTQSCKKAGTDGEATLVVFPQHHGRTIPNHAGYPDSVYIKFNTQDLPSDPTHNYDVVYVGEVGEDHVHCTTLNAGKYYLFATGWDTTINMRVSGGMAVKIKYGDRKKEIDTNVPVTE